MVWYRNRCIGCIGFSLSHDKERRVNFSSSENIRDGISRYLIVKVDIRFVAVQGFFIR